MRYLIVILFFCNCMVAQKKPPLDLEKYFIDIMKERSKVWYFKEKELYSNSVCGILVNNSEEYIGELIQIKMSDNGFFVFLFLKPNYFIPPDEEKESIRYFFYNYKYGEIDEKSISSGIIKKKRVYPENNVFTEEIWITKDLCFVLEEKNYFKLLKIKDKLNIRLFQGGVDFCN